MREFLLFFISVAKLDDMSDKFIVYSDGGSRNNPGPAAAAAIVEGVAYGQYLGVATNNEAEYQGVILALKKLKQVLGARRAKESLVEARMDSQLIARQLSGIYRIEEPGLKPLFVDAWNLSHFDFKKVEFVYVPRAENKRADAEVNRILDAESK